MKHLGLIVIFLSFFVITTFSQASNHYHCSSCSNPLFLKSEIIKEKKKSYIVTYNKSENLARKDNQTTDVHCSHCNSHTGYTDKDGEVKILKNSVHKENESYVCSICKRPILAGENLEKTTKDAYVFKVLNNKDIVIVNRSYILSGKSVHCGFCYQRLGKKYKKKDLNLQKNKVVVLSKED